MTKTSITDLAMLGGEPEFSVALHVGRPNLGSRERFSERLDRILSQRWLTNHGPFVDEFEVRLANYLGVRHCIAVCNATVALELAIRALELSGEVIVPSFTFVATAHALQWQQITPVFCDIDPTTHNIDPKRVEEMITPRTTGIIGVHVWGRPCAVNELSAIAERRGLKLLFDAAHAFGCAYGERLIGAFGAAEVFSFHATKFFNTFEGGAIATNDDHLAEKLRLMKNFGFAGYDRVIHIGTNGKMSEISAAMGLTNLESLGEFIAANQRNYNLYRDLVADLPGVRVVTYDESVRHNFHYVILEIDPKEAGISRDLMVRILHAEGVLVRRYFYPGCHRMEPYRSLFPHAYLLLPETERLTAKVISLPNGTAVRPEDVARVCEIVRLALCHGSELSRRLN